MKFDREGWKRASDSKVLKHVYLQLENIFLRHEERADASGPFNPDSGPMRDLMFIINGLHERADEKGWKRSLEERSALLVGRCNGLGLMIEVPCAVGLRWLWEGHHSELAEEMAGYLLDEGAEVRVEKFDSPSHEAAAVSGAGGPYRSAPEEAPRESWEGNYRLVVRDVDTEDFVTIFEWERYMRKGRKGTTAGQSSQFVLRALGLADWLGPLDDPHRTDHEFSRCYEERDSDALGKWPGLGGSTE